LTCYIKKAKKQGSLGRLFGKWNRRFLFFNLVTFELYYTKRPNAENRSNLPLTVGFFSA
jgi:hypothetical protein